MKRANFWVLCGCLLVACQHSAKVGEDSDSVDDTDTVTTTTPTDSTDDTSIGDTATDDTATMDTESTSDTESLPEPVENEWIFIEGGSFEMGDDDEWHNSYSPRHTVSVPSFEIQKSEVTIYQYRQCVDAGGCTVPQSSEGECERNNYSSPQWPNFPVNCIDHAQATDYCSWIGGRLLSEAEWEYAARGGGQDIRYPWGDDVPDCDMVAASNDMEEIIGIPNCWSNGGLAVCSKPQGNSFHGLCDMSGNYQEWVADKVLTWAGYNGAPNDGSPWIEDVPYAVARGSDAFQIGMSHEVFNRSSEPDADALWDTSVRCGREPQ